MLRVHPLALHEVLQVAIILAAIAERTGSLEKRPRVACLEWLDPLMGSANWIPELVVLSGGEPVFGVTGEASMRLAPEQLFEADPDVIVLLPCGFDCARTRSESAALWRIPGFDELQAVRKGRVFIADGNAYSAALEALAAERSAGVVRLCAQVEAEIAELEPDEKQAFLADLGLEEPGLHRLTRAAYDLLDLISFFTAGPKELRAWTLRRGLSALRAAGVIHTDFEKHFIRAEVIPFEEYRDAGGEVGARGRGTVQIEGKDYVIQDGDVVYFRTGA